MRKGIGEAIVLANAILDDVAPRNAGGYRNDISLRAAMGGCRYEGEEPSLRDILVASAYRLAYEPSGLRQYVRLDPADLGSHTYGGLRALRTFQACVAACRRAGEPLYQ